ncbi:MAG: nucleoside-diphosphate kinase [Verrucomicrobiae bacterium]|nr:nucleoside-diphosphate kinase [Verrucomicrobiae bacterium]
MPEELSYAIITPTSIFKSRTGGVINRLLTRTSLELVAARMFAPSAELVREFASHLKVTREGEQGRIQSVLRDYILSQLGPDPKTGQKRRVLVLVFKGPEAVAKVRAVVGSIRHMSTSGDTIRGSYGDYVTDPAGQVIYFEPAVLCPTSAAESAADLQVWARHSERDGGVLENVISYPSGVSPERTLVLIKPDNFRFPTGRPGNIIDMFSRTGLYIVGFKILQMSVAQAEAFYEPVRQVLAEKLAEPVGKRARLALEEAFDFPIPEELGTRLGALLAPVNAAHQFENIVEFMSGGRPGTCPPSEKNRPGRSVCIALMYEGPGAVQKIREVLGPTDPAKAPPGSIRREFGSSIMVNAAHASDSAENAQREFRIVNISENTFKPVIEEFYKTTGIR